MIEEGEFNGLMDKYNIQDDLRPGIGRYLFYGIKPGHYLTLMLQDGPVSQVIAVRDWTRDEDSMKRVLEFFYNELPGTLWGSAEAVKGWIDSGGPNGKHNHYRRASIKPVEDATLSSLLHIGDEPTDRDLESLTREFYEAPP